LSQHPHLERHLGLRSATSLVIGSIIGTGIFLKTAAMTQAVHSPLMVLLVWCFAGALSCTGALVYAELGARYPKAGGEFIFLREGYNSFIAFCYGWMRFWIGSPASIAAYGVGCASFAGGIYPDLSANEKIMMAQGLILGFTLLNCMTVVVGGWVQDVLTALKILLVVGLGLSLVVYAPEGWSLASLGITADAGMTGEGGDSVGLTMSGLGAAMLAALWAFDGWNNMPMAAGEIRNPQRNIPLALILGTLACLLLYVGINFAYFVALPVSEIVTSNSSSFRDALPVAAKAAKNILGDSAATWIGFAFIISALGAMNGSILTGARVPYAMARDGLFFRVLANVGKRSHVPVVAVVVQGLWASVLAGSGSFDQLTNYVVFSSWIFYALCAWSLFRLRKKDESGEMTFRCPWYPWTPSVFVVLALLLLAQTIADDPVSTMYGVGIIAAGIPFFFWMKRGHHHAN